MASKSSTERNPQQAQAPEEQDSPETVAEQDKGKATATASPGEVKYTGPAGTREITKAQWKAAGVEDQDTTIWNAENDYTLRGALSEDAIDLLRRVDPHFKIK